MSTHRKVAASVRIGILLILWLAPSAVLAVDTEHVTHASLPTWVDRAEVYTDPKAYADYDDASIHLVLLDRQSNATVQPRHTYVRTIELLRSQDAVAFASQVTIDFDPSYQSVQLHAVGVHRDGRWINQLDLSKLQTLQREPRLKYQILDGRRTVFIVLEGTRPGDFVDVEYSLIGNNPSLASHYTTQHTLRITVPIERNRFRLLWPKNRDLGLAVHDGAAKVSQSDLGETWEYVWEATSIEALEAEAGVPGWFDPYPWLQLSEFDSWAEVAQWGRALYEPRAEPTASVRQKLDEIRAQSDAVEDQAIAAIRFVQEEVRYLAVVLGDGSHVPNPPHVVMKRRFGDCKDKALLLATMLRELGVSAHPALVNTERGHGIGTWLPTPTAFNHVIVRAIVEGDTMWVDPTNAHQRGNLQNLYVPPFGLVLTLAADTKDLEFVAARCPKKPLVEVERIMKVLGPDDPVELSVRTRYRGPMADATRHNFAETSRSDMAEAYEDFYESIFGAARSVGDLEVVDGAGANMFVVRERYKLDEFWTSSSMPGWADFFPYEVAPFLMSVEADEREMPIAIRYPHRFLHKTIVHLPDEWPHERSQQLIESPAFRFSRKTDISGWTAEFTFTYEALADHVEAKDAAQYQADVEALNEELQQGVYWYGASSKTLAVGVNWPIAMVALFSLGIAILLCVHWYRRPPAIGPPLEPAPKPAPTGLSGWLIPVALGVWISPLVVVAGMIYPLVEATSPTTWTILTDPESPGFHAGWGPMLTLSVVVGLMALAWSVLNLVLMMKHMRSFPLMYALLNVVMIAWFALDSLTLAWVMNSVDTLIEEVPSTLGGIFSAAVWITYLYRSKRSRATFVRPVPSDIVPIREVASTVPSLAQPIVLDSQRMGSEELAPRLASAAREEGEEEIGSVLADTADSWKARDPDHFKQAHELLMMGQAHGRVVDQIERAGMSHEDADSLVTEVWKVDFAWRREEGMLHIYRGAGVFLISAFLSMLMSELGFLSLGFLVAGSIFSAIELTSAVRKMVFW